MASKRKRRREGRRVPSVATKTTNKPPERRTAQWLPFVLAAAAAALVWQLYPADHTIPEAMRVRVVRVLPHDSSAFTQGLLLHEGQIYESTGLRGQSTLRRVNLETGEVEQRVDVAPEFFAEGLARAGDRLIQLTWRGGKALVYDLATLRKTDEHDYRGEGWGLCHDGERLIMSTGSDRLEIRDPETFERLGWVRVRRAGRPLRRLNELECANGSVYANVWQSEHIARIDPESGQVTEWVDASGLLTSEFRHGGEDVLNGIAYMPESGHFLLTGKNWSRMFEVEFVPAE